MDSTMDPSSVTEPSTSTVAEQAPLEPVGQTDAMQDHTDYDLGLSVQSIFEASVGLEFADAFMSGVGSSPMKEPGGQSDPQSVRAYETEATAEPAFIVPPTTSAAADPPPPSTAPQLASLSSASPLRDNDPVLAQNSVMASPKASALYHRMASPAKYTTLSPRRNILLMPYETGRTSAFQSLTTMMPGVSTPPPNPLDLNMADMTLLSAASTSDYDRDYDAFQQGGFDYDGPSSSRSLYGSSGLYSDRPSSSSSRPFSYSFDDARPFMPNSGQFPPIGMAFGNAGHSRQEPVFSAFRPYVASPPEDPIQPVHKQVERVNLPELGVVPRDANVEKLREPGYASVNNMMTSEEIIGYIGELKSMYTTSTDPDFHNRWPEFAALECALAARYERYNKLKGQYDLAEMTNAMDAHVVKVRLEESRLTLARAIRRLDRFVALAQLRAQDLREKFNNCVSLNDAFRTLPLPNEAVFDRKRNDLYAWEEDERLKKPSYPHYFDFYEKIVDDDGELKFRCLFDKCTYNFSTGDKRDGFGRPVKRTWPTMIGMLQRHQMKHTRVKPVDPGKMQRGRGRAPAATRPIQPFGGADDSDATPLHPDDAGYGTPTGMHSAMGGRSGHAQSSSAADYFTMYARESRDLLDSDDGDDYVAGGGRQKRGGMAARGGKRGRGRPPGAVRGRSSMTARPAQRSESLHTDAFMTAADFGPDLSESSSDDGEQQISDEDPSEPGLKRTKPKAPRKRSDRPGKKMATSYLERYEQIVQDGQMIHKCREDGCDFAVDSNDCEDLLDTLREHSQTMHRANLAPTPSKRQPKKPTKATGGKRPRTRPALSPLRHSMDLTQFDDDCPAGYAASYATDDASAEGPSSAKRGRRQEAVTYQPVTKWSNRPATLARLMRSDWPEFQALFEEFNAKWKHYVDLLLEVERGGAVDHASQRTLSSRFKAYLEASGRCEKFVALSKEQPAELRRLITEEGKSLDEVFAVLMTEEELNPPPKEEKRPPKARARGSKKAAAGDASFSLYDDNDPFAEGWASDTAADHDTSGTSEDADEQIVKEYYERLEADGGLVRFRCRFAGCECVYDESSDVNEYLVNHFRFRHKHEPKPTPSSLPKWPEYQVLCEKVKEQKRLYTELHSSVQNELDADVVRATLDRLEMRKLEFEKAELRQKQFVLVAQQKPRELRQMLDDGAGFNDVFAVIDVKDGVPYDDLEDENEDVDANGRKRQRIYYDLFCTRQQLRGRLHFSCTMDGCEFQCDYAKTYSTFAMLRKLKAHFVENHLSNGNATNPTEGARRPYTFWDEWPQLAEMHDRLQLLESLTEGGSTRESNHAELKKLQTRCEAAYALINNSAGKFHALLDAGATLEDIVQRLGARMPWKYQYKLGLINWDGSTKNAEHEDSPDIPSRCNTPDETWDDIMSPLKRCRVWSPNESAVVVDDSASPLRASSPAIEEPELVIDEDTEATPDEEHTEASATAGEPSSSKEARKKPLEDEEEMAEEHAEAGDAAEFFLDPADWPTVEVDLIRLDHLAAAEYDSLYRTSRSGDSKCLYEGCSFTYNENGKHLSATAAFRAHYQCVHFNCGLNSEHYLAMCDCFK